MSSDDISPRAKLAGVAASAALIAGVTIATLPDNPDHASSVDLVDAPSSTSMETRNTDLLTAIVDPGQSVTTDVILPAGTVVNAVVPAEPFAIVEYKSIILKDGVRLVVTASNEGSQPERFVGLVSYNAPAE